jgi:mRNA interferase RelE/StbE
VWRCIYKESFLKDLSKIQPHKTRESIEKLVFEQIPSLENPFLYKGLEAMHGYRDFYKIRIRHFRIGIRIEKQSQQVEFRRILHRKDIYRYFP